MNSKEIERCTGLPRANIRYYEDEGLLTPARLPNGYRDYSEEDVTTLKRIALLRELDVSIEEIRRLQRREVTLKEVLSRRFTDLGRKRQTAEDARALCGRLFAENAAYDTLSPEKYALPRAGQIEKEPEAAPVEDNSVRRAAARLFDLVLYAGLSTAVIAPLRWVTLWGGSPVPALLKWLLAAAIWFALEVLLTRRWGTTPGKWLLGLAVVDQKGGRPDWSTAAARTAGVWWRLALSLLLFPFGCYQLYQAAKREESGQEHPWEMDTRVTLRRGSLWRLGLYAAAWAALLLAVKGEAALCARPPHRGELTVEEFAENYNRQAKYYALTDLTRRLQSDGTWAAGRPEGAGIMDRLPPDFSFELDGGGHITAVVLEEVLPTIEIVEGRDPGEIFIQREWYLIPCALAVAAWGDGLDTELDQGMARGGVGEEVRLTSGDLRVTFSDGMDSNTSLLCLQLVPYEIHFRLERAG